MALILSLQMLPTTYMYAMFLGHLWKGLIRKLAKFIFKVIKHEAIYKNPVRQTEGEFVLYWPLM